MWDAIFGFANAHPVAFSSIIFGFLASILYIITKFDIEWDGVKPKFKSYKQYKVKLAEYEEMFKFIQPLDFLKKTENGEYIGFIVAKKPYIAMWADGNWNTEEYFQHFDRFERLWEKEDQIIIHGKNPNMPSDLYHVMERKAKDLPELTIFCGNQIHKHLTDYFKDYTNVKIVNRG
jgi:hypothetical protein